MICIGRLLNGFASGSYSVIVPQYTSEIADKEIRGTLGTYFQLQVFSGILFTYVMGSFVSLNYKILLYFYLNCHPLLQLDVHDLSKACAIIPVVYLCLLFSVPESPIFYLTKGNIIKARWSLKYFRRPFVQVDQELIAMQESLAKVQATNINLHNLTILFEVISKQ